MSAAQHTPGQAAAYEWFDQNGRHHLTLTEPADYEMPLQVTPLFAGDYAHLINELRVARAALADFAGLTEPHAHSLARRFAEVIAKAEGSAS